MTGDHDLQALLHARHPDPFAVLGLHADAQGRLCVRALLPGAQTVEVVDALSRRSVAARAAPIALLPPRADGQAAAPDAVG